MNLFPKNPFLTYFTKRTKIKSRASKKNLNTLFGYFQILGVNLH